MPALRLKIAGSLLAGGLAGVAALATLTSAPTPQLAPASDSTDTTKQQTVESPAPCPSGTVEKADSCDRIVKVQTPAEPRDAVEDEPAPPAAPSTPPAWTQIATRSHDASTDAQPTAEPQESEDAEEHDGEHDGDDEQVEQEDHHEDESSDSDEPESDD